MASSAPSQPAGMLPSQQDNSNTQMNVKEVKPKPTRPEHPREKHRTLIGSFGLVGIFMGITLAVVSVLTTGGMRSDPDYLAMMTARNTTYFLDIYQGVWCGVFLIITGIIGARLRANPTKCLYVANLTMAIMTSLAACGSFAVSLVAMFYASHTGLMSTLHGMMGFISLIALVSSVCHALFCCGGACFSDISKRKDRHISGARQNVSFVSNPEFVYQPSVVDDHAVSSETLPHHHQPQFLHQNLNVIASRYPYIVYHPSNGFFAINEQPIPKQFLTQKNQAQARIASPSIPATNPVVPVIDSRQSAIYPQLPTQSVQTSRMSSDTSTHSSIVQASIPNNAPSYHDEQLATAPGYSTLNQPYASQSSREAT